MPQLKAELAEDKVILWDREGAKDIFESDYFGKLKEDRLELSLIEACYLLFKKRIAVADHEEKEFSWEDFYEYCKKIDKRFYFRYYVYKDCFFCARWIYFFFS